jgi:hypothetical protein
MERRQRIEFLEEMLQCNFLCDFSKAIIRVELKSLLPPQQRCNISILKKIKQDRIMRKAPL